MKKYLAVYFYQESLSSGFGNHVFAGETQEKITLESIREMEKMVCKSNGYSKCVILNVISLENEGK